MVWCVQKTCPAAMLLLLCSVDGGLCPFGLGSVLCMLGRGAP